MRSITLVSALRCSSGLSFVDGDQLPTPVGYEANQQSQDYIQEHILGLAALQVPGHRADHDQHKTSPGKRRQAWLDLGDTGQDQSETTQDLEDAAGCVQCG